MSTLPQRFKHQREVTLLQITHAAMGWHGEWMRNCGQPDTGAGGVAIGSDAGTVAELGVAARADMTRLYGSARRGVRVYEATPQGHWQVLTILGAMSAPGILATMTIPEATDAEIFLAYLDHVLCPKLQPGDVVVMDNLSSYKVHGVRERIETAGAEVLYLPPYSPDLNPIEKAWSKLKQNLRGVKSRTFEALD